MTYHGANVVFPMVLGKILFGLEKKYGAIAILIGSSALSARMFIVFDLIDM
jgi:hypothetical protein